MRRAFTQTHYCADATCKGFDGFEVRWNPDMWDPTWGGQPAEPQTDTCPHCHSGMLDEPVSYEDAIDGLMDELQQGNAIGSYDFAALDRKAVLAAVQQELQRQERDARNARLGLTGLTGKAYYNRIDEIFEGGA